MLRVWPELARRKGLNSHKTRHIDSRNLKDEIHLVFGHCPEIMKALLVDLKYKLVSFGVKLAKRSSDHVYRVQPSHELHVCISSLTTPNAKPTSITSETVIRALYPGGEI